MLVFPNPSHWHTPEDQNIVISPWAYWAFNSKMLGNSDPKYNSPSLVLKVTFMPHNSI